MVNRAPENREEVSSWDLRDVSTYLSPFQVEMCSVVRADEHGPVWQVEAATAMGHEWPWHGMARGPDGERLRFRELCGPLREVAQAWAGTRLPGCGEEDHAGVQRVVVQLERCQVQHPVWVSSRAVDAAVAGALLAGGAGICGAEIRVPAELHIRRSAELWDATVLAEKLGLEPIEHEFIGVGGTHLLAVLHAEMTRAL